MSGKMIVIEGCDGAGCETQSKLLKENIEKKCKKPVLYLFYPDYRNSIGKLIHKFLHEEFDLDVKTQFILYSLDMIKDMQKIKRALKDNRFVVTNRYFLSTMAYQGLQGFSHENALLFADMFEIEKPDLAILLRIMPETSLKRKKKEKNHLDRWERDAKFQRKVAAKYEELAKNKIFAKKWVVIDGEKPANDIGEEIFKIVASEFGEQLRTRAGQLQTGNNASFIARQEMSSAPTKRM